jgi:hypothetical protein
MITRWWWAKALCRSARQIQRLIRETNPNANFDVASNPEFIMEWGCYQRFHAAG